MLKMTCRFVRCLALVFSAGLGVGNVATAAETRSPAALEKIPGAKPRNVVLIVADDHRFDALGCAGHPFLQTPHLDALAAGGVLVKNAFVTTSLCSPSRASILTGLYAHRHRVIDNNTPLPPGLVFFPQYLKQAGYATAFVGKWHMGSDSDAPQPGYDRWVSFKGQGTYWPNPNGLNVNGKHVPQKGYITDELTDYAVDWLGQRPADRPFFLHVAHKAVHTDMLPDESPAGNPGGKKEGKLLLPGSEGPMGFIPAPRHAGCYAAEPFTPPETMAVTERNYGDKPMWVRNRRNSRHGVELPFGNRVAIPVIYRQYMETLRAVDNSVGRIVDELRKRKLLDSTLVIFMGDNGYAWGEHGMIDKRSAYEESMRIPLVVHCPEAIAAGIDPKQMIANIDIGPTVLEAAGLKAPAGLDGRSFLPLLSSGPSAGGPTEWREELLYEYYWEWNFPMTPTIHALRTDRYKFIRPYGLWDVEELYDLAADPHEITNLINDPAHKETAERLKRQLFARLKATDGMTIPLFEDRGGQGIQRAKEGTPGAPFPERFLR